MQPPSLVRIKFAMVTRTGSSFGRSGLTSASRSAASRPKGRPHMNISTIHGGGVVSAAMQPSSLVRRKFAMVTRAGSSFGRSGLASASRSGTSFMTTRDTLARNPHTYFAAMLRMQPPSTPSSANTSLASSGGGGSGSGGCGDDDAAPGSSSTDGVEFFIDRDPTHFRFILNYLRDSYIGLDSFGKEDLHFLEELSHEAQFFNIAGLCADISRRMSEIARKHREGPSGDKDFRLVQCSTAQIQDLFHEWVIEKNYEFECMQIVADTAYIVLGRRVSRGELALVERLMKT
eukprot:jgi/Undpi1/2775/HiC_scaffold_14.g06152.m1